jgi:ABC-type cobalamin/Fe3+-siderophores transport system ATPase subunit
MLDLFHIDVLNAGNTEANREATLRLWERLVTPVETNASRITCFYGPPGCGKTTLTGLLRCENRQVYEIHMPTGRLGAGRMNDLFETHGDKLFIATTQFRPEQNIFDTILVGRIDFEMYRMNKAHYWEEARARFAS